MLVYKWNFNTPVKTFGFLQREDNAAWLTVIARSSSERDGHLSTSIAGPILDTILNVVKVTTTRGAWSNNNLNVDNSLRTLLATYSFLQFIAVLTIGYLTVSLVKRYFRFSIALLIAVSAGLANAALLIPVHFGHLTQVAAITYFWIFIGTLIIFDDSLDWLHRSIVTAIFAIGLGLCWWPLFPVSIFMLCLSYAIQLKVNSFNKSRMTIRAILKALVWVAVTTLFLIVPSRHRYESEISYPDLLAVGGGVHMISPVSLVLVSMFVLGFVLIFARLRTLEKKTIEIVAYSVSSIGVTAAVVYVASYYIAPSYLPSYAANKMLLLACLVTVPIIVAVVSNVSSWISNTATTVILSWVVFSIGLATTGWNMTLINVSQPPYWAEKMIENTSKTNETVLCHASDPSQNMDAYLCSRIVGGLLDLSPQVVGPWQTLQSNPYQDSSIVEVLVAELPNDAVIMPLTDEMIINDEDVWWMSRLNLSDPLFRSAKIKVMSAK